MKLRTEIQMIKEEEEGGVSEFEKRDLEKGKWDWKMKKEIEMWESKVKFGEEGEERDWV